MWIYGRAGVNRSNIANNVKTSDWGAGKPVRMKSRGLFGVATVSC